MPDEAVATDTEEVTGDALPALEEQGGAAAKSADEKRDAPAVHIKDPAIVSAKRAIGEYQAREYVAECRRASSDDETVVMINTRQVDSYRTIIEPEGMRLDAFYERFFINHDPNLLAGHSPTPQQRGEGIMVQVRDSDWDLEDEEIRKWHRKVKSGLLNRASIGFRPVEGHEDEVDGERIFRYTEWQLREWSFTPMASNMGATVQSRSAADALQMLQRIEQRLAAVESMNRAAKEHSQERHSQDRASQDENTDRVSASAPDATSTRADGAQDAADVPDGKEQSARADLVQVTRADLIDLAREMRQERKRKAREIANKRLGKA